MQIIQVYDNYQIMPQLAEHQLRVAAVAKQICDNFLGPLNWEGVLKVCLLHDMGNILKFDLSRFPEFVEPEGLTYWQAVKENMAKKYQTDDEHLATRLIAEELKLSEKELGYLAAVGFTKSSQNLAGDSFEEKICCYADQRVDPFGVVSIDQRLAEGKKRYAGTSHATLSESKFDDLSLDLKKLEAQIFSHASIQPNEITNESIAAYIEEIKTFQV